MGSSDGKRLVSSVDLAAATDSSQAGGDRCLLIFRWTLKLRVGSHSRVGGSRNRSERSQVPWQQFADAKYGVVGNAFEQMAHMELRIEAIELGGAGQGIDSPPSSEPAKRKFFRLRHTER